jgi:dolichyl-phosphate-mannose--protein O-mannosyl transferase
VREAHNAVICPQGTIIECGTIIRLQHVQTKKHLHTHLHQSPLSGRQEISGFGEDGACVSYYIHTISVLSSLM